MKTIASLVPLAGALLAGPASFADDQPTILKLPEPRREGRVSVESALQARRSVREYRDEPLTLADISQLLWAAQGITSSDGRRTAPSAGALYPLEVCLVAGNVTGLPAGAYRYQPRPHTLSRIASGNLRPKLASAALRQNWIEQAPVVLVFSAVYPRTMSKYGGRGVRYADLEAGHAAQSVCLQAVALNLGAGLVGAFDDDRVKRLFGMPAEEQPLYLLPVGKPK